MSGGHFGPCDYTECDVRWFADELESEIENNPHKEFGYNDEVIECLKEKLSEIRRMAKVIKAIDYLYSGDHDEDSFLEEIQHIQSNLD